jgi:hypothetical protein
MMKDPVEYRAHLRRRLEETGVPYHLWEGLVEYLASRRPVGHFLTAVLSNDLADACHRAADEETATHLVNLIRFLTHYAPANSWGNPVNVGAWLAETTPPVELFE